MSLTGGSPLNEEGHPLSLLGRPGGHIQIEVVDELADRVVVVIPLTAAYRDNG